MMDAARALQVTNLNRDNMDDRIHKSHVCLICDCFVQGAHPKGVPTMKASDIKRHSHRLSVESYEEFHQVELKDELKKEYTVPGFDGLLLSKRSRKMPGGRYAVCECCKKSMSSNQASQMNPPKYSIANGNVIGTFPDRIPCTDPNRQCEFRDIREEDISPVMKALVAPVRPFGYVLQHYGGKQQCISGHYQLFETDQTCVTGALNFMDNNICSNVFVMICGAVTPRQQKSIIKKTTVNIKLFKDIRRWFIDNSSCTSFTDQPYPDDIEEIKPHEIRNQVSRDESVDPELENTFGGISYSFSSARDPNDETSVFKTSKNFACAMVKEANPVLLLHGGNYAREHEVDIEAVLPFAFPYGMGGPNQKRRTAISKSEVIRRYVRLAMPQFMTPDVILVLHHIFTRQLSFNTGVMTCRNTFNSSNEFTKKINSLKASDFETTEEQPNPCANANVNSVVKSIQTSCKSMGHTAEAAKAARRRQFAMIDFFGLNSLFLTITPDDECSFRVRLYADPNKEVSAVAYFTYNPNHSKITNSNSH